LSDRGVLAGAAGVLLAVVAGVAMVLAVVALRRARGARRAADAAAAGLRAQAELLDGFGVRLEAFAADALRLERQVASARRATFPVLRATWRFGGSPNLPVGTVDYVGGSEPAVDVGVLVRWRDRDFFHTALEMVGPLSRSVSFSAAGCDAAAVAGVPLPDDPFKLADPQSASLGVTWTDPDGTRRWWGQRYRYAFGFPEPDGPAMSGTWAATGAQRAALSLTGTAGAARPAAAPGDRVASP
jgi:hypothetical protein